MREEGGAARGFLVGYDRRFLSREAAHWAAEVMAGAEIPCLVVEREAPTPMLMFAVSYYSRPYQIESPSLIAPFCLRRSSPAARRGIEGGTLLPAVLVEGQIEKMVIGEDGKGIIVHRSSLTFTYGFK